MTSAEARAKLLEWLRGRGIATEPFDLAQRVGSAVELAEGALLGTEPRRAIWEDSDYLVAIIAVLTGDGGRARRAALAEYARRPVE